MGEGGYGGNSLTPPPHPTLPAINSWRNFRMEDHNVRFFLVDIFHCHKYRQAYGKRGVTQVMKKNASKNSVYIISSYLSVFKPGNQFGHSFDL